MAQTVDPVSMADGDVEYSTNGTSWTSLSGSTTSVEDTTQTRMSGETYSLDGDTALITYGKREPMELTFKSVYTETSGEAFEAIRALFEAGTLTYFRWSPKGIGASGRFVFTTANGLGAAAGYKITEFTYPGLDATSGDPIMAGWKTKVPAVQKTTTASSTGLGS